MRRRWWIAAGLAVVLAGAGVGTAALLGAFRSAPTEVRVSVFLKRDATAEQKSAIKTYLHSLRVTGDVHFETREEAYQNFQEIFKDKPDFVASARPEYLPESFRFVLADKGDLAAVKARLQAEPGVLQVITSGDKPPGRASLDPARAGDLDVYLTFRVTADEKAAIEAFLRTQRATRLVFETRDEAYQKWLVLTASDTQLAALIAGPEFLPETFHVTLADAGDVDRVATQLREMPGVHTVSAYKDLFRTR